MANATKLRSVLLRTPRPTTNSGVLFEHDSRETPADDRGLQREVVLDVGDWRDMGSPDTITVTIEPGDRLNED